MPLPAKTTIHQLSKRSDYQRAKKDGRLLKGKALWVYALAVPDDKIRIGLSVSSHIIKNATDRNRIRRIIKEWFRTNANAILVKGCDIVITLKRAILSNRAGSEILRQDLSLLIKQQQ